MKYTGSKGFGLLILLTALSCRHKQTELTIKIEKSFISHAVPSGSGLASLNDSVYIIGDDAEYAAKLSVSDSGYRKIGLYANAPENRIDYSVKHDLESAILGTVGSERFMLAFGSGSISPLRDTLFALAISNDTGFRRSLTPLYNAVKLRSGISKNELNIEGAALLGDKLILFNRGKNLLILLSWKDFSNYILQQNAGLPPFQIINVSLPVINSFQIGFSGACALGEDELLFTASLEETNDPTKDGAIKGSYIGILKLANDGIANLVSFSNLKTESGSVVLDKLESIEVIERKGNIIQSIAVADNDDGNSKIFLLQIKTN